MVIAAIFMTFQCVMGRRVRALATVPEKLTGEADRTLSGTLCPTVGRPPVGTIHWKCSSKGARCGKLS